MKRIEPELIGRIIDRVMLEGDNSKAILEQRASFLWPEVVGPGINRFTSRRYVVDGVLHVYLTSAPLKNELAFCRQRIADAINEAIGQKVIHSIEIH